MTMIRKTHPLYDVFKFLHPAVSDDEPKRFMTGVLYETGQDVDGNGSKDFCRFVATDGFRLHKVEFEAGEEFDDLTPGSIYPLTKNHGSKGPAPERSAWMFGTEIDAQFPEWRKVMVEPSDTLNPFDTQIPAKYSEFGAKYAEYITNTIRATGGQPLPCNIQYMLDLGAGDWTTWADLERGGILFRRATSGVEFEAVIMGMRKDNKEPVMLDNTLDSGLDKTPDKEPAWKPEVVINLTEVDGAEELAGYLEELGGDLEITQDAEAS